jgi:hypothetical protein
MLNKEETQEISIDYINVEKVWPTLSKELLYTYLKSLKLPYTWIAGTFLFPGEILDMRIKRQIAVAYWVHHNLPIDNIISFHTTGNGLTTYTQIINISSQKIMHYISHSLKMKAFL